MNCSSCSLTRVTFRLCIATPKRDYTDKLLYHQALNEGLTHQTGNFPVTCFVSRMILVGIRLAAFEPSNSDFLPAEGGWRLRMCLHLPLTSIRAVGMEYYIPQEPLVVVDESFFYVSTYVHMDSKRSDPVPLFFGWRTSPRLPWILVLYVCSYSCLGEPSGPTERAQRTRWTCGDGCWGAEVVALLPCKSMGVLGYVSWHTGARDGAHVDPVGLACNRNHALWSWSGQQAPEGTTRVADETWGRCCF